MTQLTRNGEPGVRPATRDDIPVLAIHHRKMFEEIREKSGNPLDLSVLPALERAYAEKLRAELGSGACVAWVVEAEGRVVASGAVSTMSYVPVPHDLSLRIAFLHSIYTEPGYRNRGFARRITLEATGFCKKNGIRRLYLFASGAGRPVYEKNGFVPVPNMMLLLQG
jgi:GNAT superfamily N-acetyltransferase